MARSDFIHKLGLVFKELNESEVWLQLIMARSLVSDNKAALALDNCTALCRIVAVSRRTARANQAAGPKTKEPEIAPGSSKN